MAERGLLVVVTEGVPGADTLVAELREVAQITVRKQPPEGAAGPLGVPRLMTLRLDEVEPVTVPTLRLGSGAGPLTAVPNYLLTFFTLGLWPTRTPQEHSVVGLLLLPDQPPQRMIWSAHEDLFAWLPLLPITPFWAAWRGTSAGAVPDPWQLAAQDLRAMLADAAGSSR